MGDSLIREPDDNLIYPYMPQQTMHFEIELAEVLILKVPDAILNRISGRSVEESHIIVEKVR